MDECEGLENLFSEEDSTFEDDIEEDEANISDSKAREEISVLVETSGSQVRKQTIEAI